MIPDQIINIIKKHESEADEISSINAALDEIMIQLIAINSNIFEKLRTSMNDLIINDHEQEWLNDSRTLREYISSLRFIDKTPNFEEHINIYLCSDNICPLCNVKFVDHILKYKRIANNSVKEDALRLYRCPNCDKKYILDCDIESCTFENTNINIYSDLYRTKCVRADSLIILSNTMQCSSNDHQILDVVAEIPIFNEEGKIETIFVNVSYCENCDRYIMLKNDFKSIEGIIACRVIDATYQYSPRENYDEIEIRQKESILYQYGYNVKTKDAITSKQRHLILSMVIESGVLSRQEICSHLDTLIERGSKIEKWNSATQKWKQDRHYVNSYKTDNLPKLFFEKVVLKYGSIKTTTI